MKRATMTDLQRALLEDYPTACKKRAESKKETEYEKAIRRNKEKLQVKLRETK